MTKLSQKESINDPRYGRAFIAKKAAVASPNDLATVVGNQILQKGGNAVDAMVAVNSTLGVVFPHMTGVGGDSFWLIYDAKTKQTYTLNASGRSGSNVNAGEYKGQKQINERGPKSAITVPGAVGGWADAHKRFGKLSFQECLQPAIDYARNGFPVNESLAKFSETGLSLIRSHPTTAKAYLKDGVAPYLAKETMKNEALANTLEAIAKSGGDAFYKGEITEKICNFLKENGGFLTKEDFENHQSDWVEPLKVNYRGRTVIAPPPNSEGMVTLQILGMLENFNLKEKMKNSADFIDVFTRATALAFKDRDMYLDDEIFNKVPTDQLLSETYLKNRADTFFNPALGSPEEGIGKKGDTTFSCAVDDEGNAVGVIQSLYWEWGSGLVAGDTGVLLQNRGSFFSLNPEQRNSLKPNKRPAHTLTCSMVLNDDGPELIVGAMGGEGEPQTQALIITRVIEQGMSVQEAIDAPRWLLGRTWGDTHRGLRLEGRFDKSLINKLSDLGHTNISLIEDFSDLVGHAQAIQIFPDRIEAGADPRANGLALGY